MTREEIKDLFSTACRISKVLDDFFEAKSTTITVQDGIFAGKISIANKRLASWARWIY